MPGTNYPWGARPEFTPGTPIVDTEFETYFDEQRSKYNLLDVLVAKLMTMLGYNDVSEIPGIGSEGQVLALEGGKAQWVSKISAPNDPTQPDAPGVRYLWDTRVQDNPITILDDTEDLNRDGTFVGAPTWQVSPPMVSFGEGEHAIALNVGPGGSTNHSLMSVYDYSSFPNESMPFAIHNTHNKSAVYGVWFVFGTDARIVNAGTLNPSFNFPTGLHSVQVVYDDPAGLARLYVDGSLVSSGSYTGFSVADDRRMVINAWLNETPPVGHTGKIGITGYWNRALSDAEVVDNHNWLRAIYPTLPEYTP